jgi:hypothetical protein
MQDSSSKVELQHARRLVVMCASSLGRNSCLHPHTCFPPLQLALPLLHLTVSIFCLYILIPSCFLARKVQVLLQLGETMVHILITLQMFL